MSDSHDREGQLEELARRLRGGERRALAMAITLVESSRPDDQTRARQLLRALLPYTGNSVRIGISGAPGVGKSTFIECLGMHLVQAGHRIAVLAVDPSSSVSGGSILGDKTRMPQLSVSSQVFVRPSPSGGSLGGVGLHTREALLLCEAAGYDVVLIETVGVGQSEFAVAGMTDTFLLLALAGAGDELQGIKRGILELIDVLAITKADGENVPAASRARAEYASALRLLRQGFAGERSPGQVAQYEVAQYEVSRGDGARGNGAGSPVPEVFLVSALTGQGVKDVWSHITQATQQARASGAFAAKRAAQRRAWFAESVERELRQRFFARPGVREHFDSLQMRVFQGTLLPGEAARQLLDSVYSVEPDRSGDDPKT